MEWAAIYVPYLRGIGSLDKKREMTQTVNLGLAHSVAIDKLKKSLCEQQTASQQRGGGLCWERPCQHAWLRRLLEYGRVSQGQNGGGKTSTRE